MNHRIRAALAANGGFEKLSGTVEVDKTYIGGRRIGHENYLKDKMAIIGAVEKRKGTGQMRAMVTKYVDATVAALFINASIATGSQVQTKIYHRVKRSFQHDVVNHARREYARGGTSTNTIEGMWNLFKSSYKGTYTRLVAHHLGRYVNEHVYRYNNRQYSDGERFVMWFGGCARRLTYRTLAMEK